MRAVPGQVHLCLEEGTQSAWLHEILEPHVFELVVMVPPKSRGSKDDLRDAWSRANDLRVGTIETCVYQGPKHFAIRGLARRIEGSQDATDRPFRDQLASALKQLDQLRDLAGALRKLDTRGLGKGRDELASHRSAPAAPFLTGRDPVEPTSEACSRSGWSSSSPPPRTAA